jgi:hypothetical protein
MYCMIPCGVSLEESGEITWPKAERRPGREQLLAQTIWKAMNQEQRGEHLGSFKEPVGAGS